MSNTAAPTTTLAQTLPSPADFAARPARAHQNDLDDTPFADAVVSGTLPGAGVAV
ncbi:hypothetical protein [Microbacterium allomyrinae]|uniref:Uncharacterized protein n=1 Tax=Microbacterium allomyrinae TaxID=2830666 RepID=A0A9X1LSY9_9MICO|nr:hypothetical protein [Microbacterium allomyrinae]MCC2031073.1 hypothetical protein [Microbacterium allomyrinae]